MNPFWQKIFGDKLPTVEYCEKATDSIIARPGYFISNFAYIFVGIYILTRKSTLAKFFGSISILIGLSSALYDASFLYYPQILDLVSMGIFGILLVCLNIQRLYRLNNKKTILLGIILFTLLIITIAVLGARPGRGLFGMLIFISIVTELMLKRANPEINHRNYKIALVLFIVGLLIWILDGTDTLCSPIAWINGRGVFHYMTAMTIYYLYKHYEMLNVFSSKKEKILS